MYSFIKSCIWFLPPTFISVMGESYYEKRLQKKSDRLRLYAVLHWVVVTLVLIVACTILDEIFGGRYGERITECFSAVILFETIALVVRFLFCYQQVMANTLIQQISGYAQVRKADRSILWKNRLKKEEFEQLQGPVIFILDKLAEEAKAIPEKALELEIGKKKGRYFITMEYWLDGQEKEAFETATEELKKCITRLSVQYETKITSNKDYESVRLYIA